MRAYEVSRGETFAKRYIDTKVSPPLVSPGL
jgi:hypothetical protein